VFTFKRVSFDEFCLKITGGEVTRVSGGDVETVEDGVGLVSSHRRFAISIRELRSGEGILEGELLRPVRTMYAFCTSTPVHLILIDFALHLK